MEEVPDIRPFCLDCLTATTAGYGEHVTADAAAAATDTNRIQAIQRREANLRNQTKHTERYTMETTNVSVLDSMTAPNADRIATLDRLFRAWDDTKNGGRGGLAALRADSIGDQSVRTLLTATGRVVLVLATLDDEITYENGNVGKVWDYVAVRNYDGSQVLAALADHNALVNELRICEETADFGTSDLTPDEVLALVAEDDDAPF